MSAPESATPAEGVDTLVGRCYTKARRHPLVIGRWPGGGVLWGGPYSVPQLIVMVGSFVALILFRSLWAHFGVVLNVMFAFAVPYALGWTVRRLNVDGRNPLAAAGSFLGLLTAPAAGRLGGRPLKTLDRARPVRGVCTVTWQEPAALPRSPVVVRPTVQAGGGMQAFVGEPGAAGSAGPEAVVEAAKPRVLSGVGALIAARAAGSGHEIEKG
ncbi:hypothetical protein [Streptomyces alanosinicus]|uniref:Uncharacterized protein n=1 Tax=Streptomyces alanosinicus TaxID=68171 RepID=A0A919D7V3_9ACTN|nr:hypothetical protein [Streptomyces alanosinicus]GHE13802.1 hypothetical protein GCM10010339_82050 [Streptomyces alanosinicus]